MPSYNCLYPWPALPCPCPALMPVAMALVPRTGRFPGTRHLVLAVCEGAGPGGAAGRLSWCRLAVHVLVIIPRTSTGMSETEAPGRHVSYSIR